MKRKRQRGSARRSTRAIGTRAERRAAWHYRLRGYRVLATNVWIAGYELDDDPGRIDIAAVHRFISEKSYWAPGRDYEMQERLVREAKEEGLREGARTGV